MLPAIYDTDEGPLMLLPLISRSVILVLFCVTLTISVSTAHAQQDGAQALAAENANSAEVTLLKRAQSLKLSDSQTSENLAKEALQLSKTNGNLRIRAQIHTLLAELAAQKQHIDASKQHILEASLIYKSIEDTQHYILSLVGYAKLFFEQQEYGEGFNIIDDILPLAYEHGEDQPIAAALTAQGYAHYDQQRYNDALAAYEEALRYMTDQDDNTRTELGRTYHQIAQAYKQLKDHDKSSFFHKYALDVFTTLQNQALIARALKNVAIAEYHRDNHLVALDYSIRSIAIHDSLNNPDEHAEVLMLGSMIYREIGRYEKSLEYINEAHLMYKELDNIARTAETSNQMGHLYKKLNQYEQARSFYQLSIDLPPDKVAPKTIASALRELAMMDYRAGKYEVAMKYAQDSYKLYATINDKPKVSATARIIGQIYQALGNDNQATVSFRKALSLANESGSREDQIKALNTLGRALLDSDNHEATALLRASLELATQVSVSDDKLSVYASLRKAEKAQGNIAEALRLAEEEISLSKKLNKEKEKNEFIRAKALLDSHKMETELEFLRKQVELDKLEIAKKNNEIEIVNQSSQISKLELTKNRYSSILLATLLLICTLIATYIYRASVATKKRNKELDYLAARDPLTNCYNRRTLFDLMKRDFADVEQLDEYSIIMADIDHFKRVNDTHGHNAGDAVLRGVANILQSSVRQSDIVARFGGEEFCIICPRAAVEKAIAIAEDMRTKIEASAFSDITVTCSFGVSSIKFDAKIPAELIDQADTALYRSKAGGRNQVTTWGPTTTNKAEKKPARD